MPGGKYEVRWLVKALKNLEAEAEYIARDNPAAAAAVVTKIMESVSNLVRHPSLGRPGRVPETRELVIPETPYIVPYRVRGKSVEILRVFHASRRWPKRF